MPDNNLNPTVIGTDSFCGVVRDPFTLFCYWSEDSLPIDAELELKAVDAKGAKTEQKVKAGASFAFITLKPNTRYKVFLTSQNTEGQSVELAQLPHEVHMPRGEITLPHMTPSSDLRFRSPDILYQGISETPPKHVAPRSDKLVGRARSMIILHAHLPYVRHPEYDDFFEERWLFEAITETYLPLASMLWDLKRSGVGSKIGLVVSPTLLEMLFDKLLNARYAGHLENLLACAKNAARHLENTMYAAAADVHYKKIAIAAKLYHDNSGDVIGILSKLEADGLIELIGCCGTHALLPTLATKQSVHAQLKQGLCVFEQYLGKRPKGFWLSECAYSQEAETALLALGVKYTFLDAHSMEDKNTHRPSRTERGLVVFRRNPNTGMRVWSSEEGYPGDPVYREFYRDFGFEASEEVLGELTKRGGPRDVGLKFHRITGNVPLGAKDPYDPARAELRVKWHAKDFAELVAKVASENTDAVLTSMYDAELFGHWWFEGIDFLREYFVAVESIRNLTSCTPSDVLPTQNEFQTQTPTASSWGLNGYFEQWLNSSNAQYLPMLHRRERVMALLASENTSPDALMARVLNQAARELMLLSASDWMFLISTSSAPDYALRRIETHTQNFDALTNALENCEYKNNNFIENTLLPLEERNAIFKNIDYKIFAL